MFYHSNPRFVQQICRTAGLTRADILKSIRNSVNVKLKNCMAKSQKTSLFGNHMAVFRAEIRLEFDNQAYDHGRIPQLL